MERGAGLGGAVDTGPCVKPRGLRCPSAGDWTLTFAQGTSTEGMQQVRVDAQTGEASAIE